MSASKKILRQPIPTGLALAACLAVLPPVHARTDRSLTFLDQAAWEKAVRSRGVDPDEITNPLQWTEEMRTKAEEVARLGSINQKLDQIQFYLFDERHFQFSYEPDTTLTAREAFETGHGNCVSFTNLFIALARSVGLPVEAALVFRSQDPETEGDLIIVNNHIVAAYRTGNRTFLYDFYRFREGAVVGFEPIDDLWNTSVYLNNMGTRALRRGELQEALRLLEASVSLAPRFTAALGNLGVVRRRTGNIDGAMEAYLRALRLKEHNPTIRSNVAKLVHVETMERIEDAGWTTETIPDSVEGLVTKGDLRLAALDVEGAREYYREARLVNPESAIPLLAMARLQMIRGRTAASGRSLERALELDPENDRALSLLQLMQRIEEY
jgi:hypothetical protein